MVSIKNVLFSGLVSGAMSISAQGQAIDSTSAGLSEVLADDYYYVVQEKGIDYNDRPDYDNPRINSIIDLVKNQDITQGYYKDMNGKYVLFRQNIRKGFIIKMIDDMGYVYRSYLLDNTFQPMQGFINNGNSEEDLREIASYCAAVPLVEKTVYVAQ